jgi:Family of unknown function (DUF5723)
MKNKHQLRSLLLFVITIFISLQLTQGQVSTTLYHMYGVPQSNQLNPAFQSRCDAYLGFPMLSPLSLNADVNPLRYNDIFSYNSSLDQIITFMNENGDKEAFLNALNPVNAVTANVSLNPLSMGWRSKQFYFTIDFTEKIESDLRYTKDFARFILYGSPDEDRFNFSETGIDFKYYHELALGISYDFEEQFQVGARAKILFGMANVSTRLSDMTLRTTPDRWDFNSNMMFNISVPFLSIPLDSAGYVLWDSIPGSTDAGLPDPMTIDYVRENFGNFFGTRNLGLGIDFGFNFKPIESLSISASVNDLGFIMWRNNPYQLKNDGTFGWKGIEVSLEKDWDPGDILLDSLKSQMNFTSEQKSYTTALSGKVYLGLAYELNKKVKFGFVTRSRIYNYRLFNQYTFSANVMPINMFSATLSYSIIGKNYTNIGLGLSLRLGPFNMYFITDQAPSAYFLPETINSLNFRFGLNLVFGCPKMAKKLQDRPLID